MRFVAISVMTISTSAPTRSNQGARLKNSHHSAIANPHNTPISKPMAAVRGKRKGTTNHASHCSTTAITPGHSRSRFGGVGNAICSGVILVRAYARQGQFVHRCATFVISVSLWLRDSSRKTTTETQRTQRLHREEVKLGTTRENDGVIILFMSKLPNS